MAGQRWGCSAIEGASGAGTDPAPVRDNSESRNASTSACDEADSALNALAAAWPWFLWRLIASVRVTLAPSCSRRLRARRPHSAGVRTWLRVPWPPFWTMPSPVPTSWSRKSLNGWIVLSPIAAGTVYAPALITVPAVTVVSVATWQVAQPMLLNAVWPRVTAAVIGPRGGAFRERMKLVKAVMSPPSSSGSAVRSNAATELPFELFSVGASGLVMPISLRYASIANDSRLACWFFQPNRAPRTTSPASVTGTWMNVPRCAAGWASEMLFSALESIAAM